MKEEATKSGEKKVLIRDLNSKPIKKSNMKKQLIILVVFMVFLGIGTGFVASALVPTTTSGPISALGGEDGEGEIKKGYSVGVDDSKEFPDSAEGVLREGGIDGEGEYHLERPGGESQNVYLTSSIIDLSAFLDKKIKVNGKTFDAQKAGWLMDVGRVEVL